MMQTTKNSVMLSNNDAVNLPEKCTDLKNSGRQKRKAVSFQCLVCKSSARDTLQRLSVSSPNHEWLTDYVIIPRLCCSFSFSQISVLSSQAGRQ